MTNKNKVTFNCLINKLDDFNNSWKPLAVNDSEQYKKDIKELKDIISALQQEYAPVIELTEYQRTDAVGLLDFKRDELTFAVGEDGNGDPVLDTLPKKVFYAWLHPELLKVVKNKQQFWKVECYFEGNRWSHRHLTKQRADEVMDSLPNEVLSFLSPEEE